MRLSIICAVSENGVIGKDGKLPWKMPLDMKLFKNITMGHHILMGMGNFKSMGYRPLPGRINLVLTRKKTAAKNAIIVNTIEDALNIAKKAGETEFFFIGGEQVFTLALPLVSTIYFTRIHCTIDGDRFFPAIHMEEWECIFSCYHPSDPLNQYPMTFSILRRKVSTPSPE